MLAVLISLCMSAVAVAADDLDGAVVYLMDWPYDIIGSECLNLNSKGFAAIVISPPTENAVVPNRPWSERYEVISYKLESRSGNRETLTAMVEECFKYKIRIIVDIVLNNMASSSRDKIKGTAGSEATPKDYKYPEFSKKRGHFNDHCQVLDLQNLKQVRDCEYEGLSDLKQSDPYVMEKQVALMQDLLNIGVAGFLVDKAKFMWPNDLAVYLGKLNDIRWVLRPTRPIMLYDVKDLEPNEAVRWEEYKNLGLVTDYRYGKEIEEAFKNNALLDLLKKGKRWIPSENALVFLDNVYTYTESSNSLLSYKEHPENFKIAAAFMMALGYGTPFVLSTYELTKGPKESGPPSSPEGKILRPGMACDHGWNCEHKLPEIIELGNFYRQCRGEAVAEVQSDNNKQFGFARGQKCFIAFNLENTPWKKTFSSGLPKGEYCESVTEGMNYITLKCSPFATHIKVEDAGSFSLEVPPMSVRAIHTWNMIGYKAASGEEGRPPVFVQSRSFFRRAFNFLFFSV